jgi:hypothetical protein
MLFVQLRRHAPELRQAGTACTICGNPDPRQVQDHLLVGTPGTPTYQAGVCAACGRVLEQTVDKLGQALTIQVEHAQQTATQRETPAAGRAARPAARGRG